MGDNHDHDYEYDDATERTTLVGDDRDHDYEYDNATERTTLMGEDEGAGGRRDKRPRRPSHRPALSAASLASITSVRLPKVHSGNTIVNLISIILLVVASGGGLASIPLTRIVEDVVCRNYYDQLQSLDGPIEEQLCKVKPVQSQVAFLFAMVGMTEAIIGFLAAFPWGIAADRIGRKPVFSLALVGMTLSLVWIMAVLWFYTIFPVKLVALSSLFLFIGGGNAAVLGILLSMVADVIPEDKRAAAFMRLHLATLVGNLVSPALSSTMMAVTGPWPVMLLAATLVMSGAVAFLFIPETLKHHDTDEATDPGDYPTGLKSHLFHTLQRAKETLSILKSPSIILLLATCFVSTPLTFSTLQFLVQFVSKRYGVPIKYTGYVQSAYGITQIVHALVLLPWISNLLMRDSAPTSLRMANEQERDLVLAKWSYGLLFLSCMVLGFAPSISVFLLGLFIMAIGSAYSSLTRSLMSLYVDPEHRSRLFSMIGMVEVIGSLYGAPMLAGLFALGMNLGDSWIGLPYFGTGALSVLALGALLFVRVPKHTTEAAPISEEGRTHHD